MAMIKYVNGVEVELTAEEITQIETEQAAWLSGANDRVAERNRNERNTILSQSDWTQFNDSPLTGEVKTSWATYRTALRNLTAHDNWPNLEDADWPTKP
jgi:hypothetical protein